VRLSLGENGQSAVILAIMFIVLLAFVGLATDAGIIYMSFGQLRRAADAAALSAASQLREAQTFDKITEAAIQYVRLQGVPVQPGNVVVEDCVNSVEPLGQVPDNPNHIKITNDPSLCTFPVRKLVRVTVTTDVQLAFMQLFGWRDPIPLTTYAVSEAASLDIMLVIDTSFSMVFDASDTNGLDDDLDGCIDEEAGVCDGNDDKWLRAQVNPGTDNTPVCNGVSAGASGIASLLPPAPVPAIGSFTLPKNSCRPFEWVRDAAMRFVATFVNFPYDRVGIVTFGNTATLQQSISVNSATDLTATLGVLYDMDVSPAPLCKVVDWYSSLPGAPGKCQATNTGDALKIGIKDLKDNARQNALRFLILLSDGAATSSAPNAVISTNAYACPKNIKNDGNPKYDPYYFKHPCSDGDSSITHAANDPSLLYDADDYARDQALEIIDKERPTIVFTIGLGAEVTENPGTGTLPSGLVQKACEDGQPDGTLDKNLCNADGLPSGEQLLRYVADLGDGLPNSECDPNDDKLLYEFEIGKSCGTYFYAQGGANLQDIFNKIADEIFTRITE